MSNKIDKKELKEPDKFSKFGAVIFDILVKNRKRLVIFSITLAAFLAIGSIYYEYSKKRDNNASYALAVAMESLKATEGKLNPNSEKLYLEVINKYGNTFSGISAKLELADLYYKEKEFEKAYDLYQEVNKNTGIKLLKVVSLINLAYIKELQNDYDTALTYFKEMLNYKIEIFDIQAYFGMSRCFEKLHKIEEAKAIYNKVISQFPDSEHAKMAQQYLPLLDK